MGRHLTARLAWHDSGWNGRICSDPSSNHSCIGSRSLLSDRLRRDRETALEDSARGEPFDAHLPQYAPPCFWGINAFGAEDHHILHRHAFADLKDTHTIEGTLPRYSVLTWPFRISFNLDEETTKRYGKYHPQLEERINQFFAAHRERHSIVFLYLNYDNPVSGEEQRYAVVGCGILQEKGKPSRFKFTDEERRKYRSGKGMQHFPEVNWARRLTLDPQTVVRLPYPEYVRHVLVNPQDDDKLNEMRALVMDDALVPSFKYVCDSMDDDQCLFLLHQLRRSVERVGAHGIVPGYEEDALVRLDRLIAHVWTERGAYPGLPGTLAYLAKIGDQSDEPNVSRAEQLVEAVRATLPPNQDLLDEVESLVTRSDMPTGPISSFAAFLSHVRAGAALDPDITPDLMRLAQFSLSAFQIERILLGHSSQDNPRPFSHRSVDLHTVLRNPYVLAESYVPVIEDRNERWKELERPLRRDGPIGVFHIDAGLFPDESYVKRSTRFPIVAAGPERIRALALQHLSEQATSHSDSFSPLQTVYEAVCATPLFYRRAVTLRPELLTSGRFLAHFEGRITHVEDSGRSYFYLREILEAERLIERSIEQLLKRPARRADLSWVADWIDEQGAALAAEVPDFDMSAFREERERAVDALMRRSLIVLTGRPGSGKTHLVRKIVRTLLDSRESVHVLAPTGKAVLRLQMDGIAAKTIDKLLYEAWLTEGGVAGSEEITNDHLRHIGDVRNLVIDESSMLDLPKLATLFRVLQKQGWDKVNRVILVGDVNQLPPIGLGRPFEDIVSWLDEHPERRPYHLHLETNCRHRSTGRVLEFAELFVARNRYYDDLLTQAQTGELGTQVSQSGCDLRVLLWHDTDELLKTLDREMERLIRQTVTPTVRKQEGLNLLFGLSADGTIPKDRILQLERFQILTPYHSRFVHAAAALNEFVHTRYKQPQGRGAAAFTQGDKVIRLSNKYERTELIVSNGTLGVIDLQGRSRKPRVYFSWRTNPLAMGSTEQEEYDLAYATTVHKAQGSEFEHVFIVLSAHRPLLSRELVYTALTRSQESVTLFLESSDRRPLELARQRSATLGRNSSLFQRPLDKHVLLEPEPGERVDSKVEYILYRALMKARDSGRLQFSHHREMLLSLPSGTQRVKPDFLIETAAGSWVLEHLGMLEGRRYSAKWQQKRASYSAAGWEDRLVTTDDLNGLSSDNVDRVIDDLSTNTLVDTPTSAFSKHHYQLGELP